MKKKSAMILVVSVVLLAVALILMSAVGVNSKLTDGGCAVRINVGSTYDAEAARQSVSAAGFVDPVMLEATKTAIEFEADPMDESALETAAQALLASVQADYADAELVYAENYAAPQGVHHLRGLIYALIALAVAAYIYAALRFGWLKGFAAMLTAVVAAVLTGSVCTILSMVFHVGVVLSAMVAGTACLTYVYTVYVYGKMKAQAGYSVGKADMAVPLLVVVACVLLCVSCATVQTTLAAVLGSIVAAAAMHCVAPAFWGACEK